MRRSAGESGAFFVQGADAEDGGWQTYESALNSPADGQYYRVQPYFYNVMDAGTQLGLPSAAVLYEASAFGRPQNLTATQGTRAGIVELKWQGLPLAENYEVYRSDAAGGTFVLLDTIAPVPEAFTDEVVTQGVHYWYKVRATLPGGPSQFSLAAEGWPLAAPEPPTELTATAGGVNDPTDRVELKWQASAGATAYSINRRPAFGGIYSQIGSTTGAKFNDFTTIQGQEYLYTVVAINSAGVSAPSNEVVGMRGGGPPPEVLRVLPFEGTTGELYEPHAYIRGSMPAYYGWNFGAGATPDITVDPSPFVMLGEVGQYSATVTVSNHSGTDVYEFSYVVRPANVAPVIEDVYPKSGTELSVVSFSATTSGGLPTSYAWNFGGGATPNNSVFEEPVVTLGAPGAYNAALTVANPSGEDVYFFTLQVGTAVGAPAAPQNFSASDGTAQDRITLSWSSSAGAQGYRIYRDSQAEVYVEVISATSYDDLAVPDYLSHTYWVAAFNDVGAGVLSDSDAGYRELPAPAVLTATDGTLADLTRISWTSVAGAAAYKVYRDFTPDPIATLGDVTSWDDTAAGNYLQHTYFVRATNAAQDGALSPTDTGYYGLAAPAGLAASDGVSTALISVTWNAVAGATSYEVFRDTTSGAPAATVAGTAWDDLAEDFNQHTYWVRAKNSLATSGLSASDTGYRGLEPPAALTASDGTYAGYVRLGWNAVSGATGYKVYRDSQTTPVQTLGAVTTWNDAVGDYASHTYWVRGFNAAGDSGYSDSDSGFRGLPASASVTASDGTDTNKVAVSWSAVAGADKYNLYRDSTLIGDGLAATSYDDSAVGDYSAHTYRVHAVKTGVGESPLSASDTGYRGLPAPAIVSASDGAYSDRVAVSWSAVASATSYHVWRDSTQVGAGITGTTFNDTTVGDYAIHTYKVFAVSSGGASALSGQDNGYRGLPAPAAVSATDGDYSDHVTITWTAVAGAASYNIYRTNTSNLIGSVVTGNPLTLNDYDSPFSVYTYFVYPVGSGGESALYGSDTGYAGTGLITDLAASDGTFASRIRLTWSKVSGATEYRIFRSASPGAATQIATVGDVDLYDDTDSALVSETLYYYRIRAYNSGTSQLSGYSNEDTGYRSDNNWLAPYAVDGSVLSSFLYTDMATVAGLPVISYWDASNPSLEFARATTGLPGSGDWTHHTVDSSGAAAIGKNGTSIAAVNGRPAIAYCNDTAGTLKYAYASSATPGSTLDWTVMTLEAGSVGNYPALAVIAGKPAIVYHAQGPNQLKFIMANVAAPASAADWSAPYTLDTESGAGEYGTALIELGGKPAAAYHVSGSGKLKFARAGVAAPTGAASWTLYTVESGGLGQWPALGIAGGNPVIAYVDNTDLELRYAYAGNSEGSSWTATLVDGFNRTGAFGLSIVTYGGLPVIAYHESVSADLLIATALSASPAGPDSWVVVSPDENDCGDFPALALLADGNPGVAYGGGTSSLRFTRFVP